MTDSNFSYQLSDLVMSPSPITTLADPGAVIAKVCEDTAWWLDALVQTHDVAGIARVRRQIVALERAVLLARLDRDIQLDVAELARRGERAIGLAIRHGQAHGTIRAQGQKPGDSALPSPREFATAEVLSRGAYAFADVPHEVFEAALTVSRVARDLGRADMVRRVTGKSVPRGKATASVSKTRAAATRRRARIREMAKDGHNSHQIAREVGIGAETVRDIAKREGFAIPADVFVKASRVVDPNRLIEETLMGVDGHISALSLIEGLWDRVDRDKVGAWTSSLNASITSLQELRRQLKELIQP